MDKKRVAEASGPEGPDQKKSRTDGSSGAPAKPGLNLEALQKAKQLLEKQKQLREKLKKLPQVASSAGAGAALPSAATLAATANPLAPGGVPGVDAALVAAKAAKAVEIASKFGVQASLASVPGFQAAPGAAAPRPLLAPAVGALPGLRPTVPSGLGGLGGPRPLLLDAAGREVDEAGNVITHAARAPITTSLINQRRPDEPQQAPEPAGPRDEDFIDTSMARPGKDVAAHRRRRGALEFVEEGSMARQAEIMRLKQKYGEADFKKHLPSHLRRPPRGPAGPAERDANLTPLGAPAIPGLGGMADLAAGSEAQGANSVPIGVRQVEESEEDKLRRMLPEAAAPPDVEWWDKPLLVGGAYFVEGAVGEQQPLQEDGPDEQHGQPGDNVVVAAPNGSGAVMRLRVGKVRAKYRPQ
ncbi:hypothetical protein OEZ85_010043 [Tetradesmus obliquus]|uniref:Pre-mRNA-splicing factor 3 domain-containing protein n=1 Tax=Tetradesmus obliquus TaxID=3088 RepID=A0ABY8UG07_TETOB|nr:hypothetical protein OEZ85_010043 [Tetradesmus obliquus]